MAASILRGALPKSAEGDAVAAELVAEDEDVYEDTAVRLANDCVYSGSLAGKSKARNDQYSTATATSKPKTEINIAQVWQSTGRLTEMRKMLSEARWSSALFDTARWVRDLEGAYSIAWARWVKGEGGDIWLRDEM